MDRSNLLALTALCSLVCTADAGQIPIMGTVAGQPGPVQIGTIDVNDNMGMGGGITGTFTFAPGFAYLDDWYNFRWINVVSGYTINGVAQDADTDGNPDAPIPASAAHSELPALDPQPGPCAGCPPFNDGAPFYFTQAEHAACMAAGFGAICVPGVSSTFSDNRAGHPAGTVINFETYLIAENDTDPAIGATTGCLLGGFFWTYTQNTGAQAWTATAVPGAPAAAFINMGIANGNPPGFGAWTVAIGCTLSACVSDHCPTPVPIPDEGSFFFDTTGTTTDGQPDPLCLAFSNDQIWNDIWYAWSPSQTGMYDIATCGSQFDTKLAIYQGTACPAGPALDCNDDACGLQSGFLFQASAGQTYLIRVGSFSQTTTGVGQLSIQLAGGPVQSFCAGDGTTTTPCPCGNNGAPGEGCANSTGQGAVLSGAGSTSLAADDLTLTLTQLPANQFGIAFSGLNNPEFAFGDGVRCVGQGLLRSAVANSGPSGTINIPNSLGLGGLSAGGSDVGAQRFVQGWYRDPTGPCGGAFNVSQGVVGVVMP